MAGWALLVLLPLVGLVAFADAGPAPASRADLPGWAVAARSFGLAAALAAVAVAAGYVPGQLVGTAREGQWALLLGLLLPLLLPRYVLYYAWWLGQSPTSRVGDWVGRSGLAGPVAAGTAWLVMALWYWPLAALLIAQGWRGLDAETLARARLDAGAAQRLWRVTLPMLARPIALAFAVVMVLALSEFGTFYAAMVDTLGTKLAVLYHATGSERAVVRASWPLAAAAGLAAAALWRQSEDWSTHPPLDRPVPAGGRWRWGVLAGLLALSFAAPVGLMISAVEASSPLATGELHRLPADVLGRTALTAAGGAAVAMGLAAAAMFVRGLGRAGAAVSGLMQVTILLAMFLPGSLVAVALLKLRMALGVPDGSHVLSAGLGVRFAGLALVVLHLAWGQRDRQLAEAAAVDGAGRWQSGLHVHLPRLWPLLAGALLLVTMLGMTEVPATMILLPGGVPNFGQWILDHMHGLRDQDVIACCLLLAGAYVGLAAGAVGLLRLARVRRPRGVAAAAVMVALAAAPLGCGGPDRRAGRPEVVRAIGGPGRGPGRFIYPRAIELAGDGGLFVVDKTGRIQRLGPEGGFRGVYRLPKFDLGYPTGMTLGPDGNLYAADTHYHRVLAFAPDGTIARRFGRYGEDGGCFIYPTDVAFGPDGRIYVSEYGGNDRVSIFSAEGEFLAAFGSPGDGRGEMSRPSALCVDAGRGRLYVADACNHRVGVHTLDGELQRYVGSPGKGPGQLRYPYDLALMPDGALLVCEYGNNRIQLFDAAGRPAGAYGGPGRQLGQLAYPWGAAVDARRRVYVVDSGNNRIQVWQL